jgi:predicted CXXCH cytochrome family protein
VKRIIVPLLVLLLAAGTIVLLNSCANFEGGTVIAPPQIAGAHYVGDKACADCHDKITRVFPSSPHARLRLTDAKMAGQQGCESCHGPASRHVAVGGRRFIINPGKQPEACFQCHISANAEFHLPQHHPVLEGKMNCVQCHDPHGTDIMKPHGGLAMARMNEACSNCHREQTKPHVFEHPALREGCTTCHSPHGSVNQKLLTIRDNNLCLRCHAQVQKSGGPAGTIFIGNINHTTYLHYGTCWTGGCHSAVHGSNVQPYYLY